MKPAPNPAAAAAPAAQKPLNAPDPGASEAKTEVERRYADADLVSRLQQGDEAAFRILFDTYHRRAFGVAMGVVKNQQDALDIMQEAFIKVHKHIGSFQGNSSFYTWLYRIVMNLAIDHVRRKRKLTDFDDTVRKDDVAGDGTNMPRVENENPSKTVVRKELSNRLWAAFETLPEIHRKVIVLREIEGMSYEEMAQVLRVPKGTIMSRLFHARHKMQQQLEGYLDGDLELKE